eukprot:TRINITY_DN1939_c0_g1_i1.p2 TRINITY_DN1939_c0_g1~~TRINITY_DN1939_c0_g1_i1.p2  ORF type:complete len:176 (+),score=26.32 TRINITY_DN1939_c0_g1_i1:37-528(+)
MASSRAAFVALLLILAVTSVSAADKVQKLVLRAVFPPNGVANTAGYPFNATSYQTRAGYLYNFNEKNATKFIGFVDGQATVLLVTPRFIVFDIDFTYQFLNIGKLLVKGNIASDIVNNELAITGGTGKYMTARGQAVDEVVAPKSFRFKPSAFEFKIVFTVVL